MGATARKNTGAEDATPHTPQPTAMPANPSRVSAASSARRLSSGTTALYATLYSSACATERRNRARVKATAY